jgi:hypothetical protein
MKKIHVGFLLSYDYNKLKLSIPPVYKEADRIFMALDKNHVTWSGNSFTVDQSFYDWLKELDTENKIEIYRDDFYISGLTPIQNDTRERHLLSLKMGLGNWLIQVDSDEYFIDFKAFTKVLRRHNHLLDNPERHPVQFAGFHINIYKYLDDGLLYVNKPTKFLLATNYPNYKNAKNTKERIIYSETFVLHEGLARTEEELALKLANWGHMHEVNNSFLEKWKIADKDNYHTIKDVFYLDSGTWKELGYLPSRSLEDVKKLVYQDKSLSIPPLKLFFRNFGQWFKHSRIKKGAYKPAFEKYF